jgi:methionyl-tRNA formyltransferase
LRLVFLGSPPFATPVLAALLESRHRVLALVTRPDKPRGRGRKIEPSPLAERASGSGIPVLQPPSARDAGFVREVAAFEPDVLLVASYGEILDRPLLELAPKGALNVHASLLPRHRGASPIQAAILAGDMETGVSVQRMVLALDEGDVLLEKRTEIGPRENAGALLERLALLGGEAALEALDLLESGKASFTAQDPARATYARRIRKDAGRVDWNRSAAEIVRHVRAMTPWPGARTTAPNGKEVLLLDVVEKEADSRNLPPGSVLPAPRGLTIAAGAGAVSVLSLQSAGGAPLESDAWLRGARLQDGARFV